MEPEVVVVGAGPVGLWLAAELALAGVAVTLLERDESRSPHSKALGIHPRTVEVLAMRGAEKEFLDHGRPMPSRHFAMLPTRLDFSALDTPCPFMLAYPQARTEEHLEQRAKQLGVQIRRGVTVTGITQNRTSVEVESDRENLTANWVVGCDGASSTVRRAAGIEFNRSLANKISGLEVTYPAENGHPLTGQRVPGEFHLLRQGRPVLLTSGRTGTDTARRHAGALGIATRRSPLLGSAREDWNTAGAALIRPDGHVWWAGSASSPIIDSDLTSRLTHLPARF